ncbi:hypothetical protein FGG08_004690 [Glutinoglossum americanum]|uniref:RFX-type winged-helix domain-containing protein n=1 Tax=Glutinoglossum americanum TaxID=1670608 RepID=A0A9P8KZA3_9PEZI|nr:hypothetical protein FGG08_004690 [Glutinoglossum americanum]
MAGPPSQPAHNGSTKSRSRSSTSASSKGRPRPASRASTTSAHSNNARSSLQQQGPQQAYPFSPEGMILHSAQHLTNPHGFAIDPALNATTNQGLPVYSAEGAVGGRHEISPPSVDYSGFELDGQMLDVGFDEQDQDQDAGAGGTAGGKPTRKGTNPDVANDIELRRLHQENRHRSLEDIGNQLRKDEGEPWSEKTRQVFAMSWLTTACKKEELTIAVPRGRVYAYYVSKCAVEKVKPLNPASFGKLVRIVFNNIKTRRLGVRGQSKYHYCGLSLHDDRTGKVVAASNSQSHRSRELQPGPNLKLPQPPTDVAIFPAPGVPLGSKSSSRRTTINSLVASGRLFCEPSDNSKQSGVSTSMTERELRFPTSEKDPPINPHDPIELPSIDDYAALGTDPDAAATLTALYRSHCTSLIESLRYMRIKQFFHLFTSFHGTLTVPNQKLFADPSIAPWIKECDWLMYKTMIGLLSPLTLQVVPAEVINAMSRISESLGAHVRATFHSHPPHVIEAKIGPATIFASLLNRLLRVNATAHAAAKMLCNVADRNLMYNDYLLYVRPIGVVESELPNCGYNEVLRILTTEIGDLLQPLSVPWELDLESNQSVTLSPSPRHQSNNSSDPSTEGVLDRWTAFFKKLPQRFPQTDARTILQCFGGVSTAVLRDITMNSGQSFGAWWVVKVFLDEWMAFLAERGGFMSHKSACADAPESAMAIDATSDTFDERHGGSGPRSGASSHPESRPSSVDGENTSPTLGPNISRGDAISPMAVISQAAMAAAAGFGGSVGPDDSGVSMRMSEEDLTMGKYDFVPDSTDTAGGDVVVC